MPIGILLYFFPALFIGAVVYLLYRLLGGLRLSRRVASRTYLTGFLLEMASITVLPQEVLGKLGLDASPAYIYPLAFITAPMLVVKSIVSGKGYDYLALLLLPIIPALLVYWLSQKYSDANKASTGTKQ